MRSHTDVALDIALYAVQMCQRLEVIAGDDAKTEIAKMRIWLSVQIGTLTEDPPDLRHGHTKRAERRRAVPRIRR